MPKPISLTVHKNTSRKRHRKDVRQRLHRAAKETPPDADGFLLISWTALDDDTELAFSGGFFKDKVSARLGLNDALRSQFEELLEEMRQAGIEVALSTDYEV